MPTNLDTIESHIDYIRELIRETSDDTRFTDELIYKALVDARAVIIERRIKKNKEIPQYMYQTICVPLCIDTFNDCDCIPSDLDCKVLKSKYPIPKGLYNGTNELVRVALLNNKEVFVVKDSELRYIKYRNTRKNDPYYVRRNNYLYIFNVPQNRLRAVIMTGVFDDPKEANGISICDESGIGCEDTLSSGFSMQKLDNNDMYQIVLQVLGIAKQLPEDRTNDAESIATEQKF